MTLLKWIGYSCLAMIGVGLIAGIGAVLSTLGAVIGILAVGAFIVFLVAAMIREYFEGPKT